MERTNLVSSSSRVKLVNVAPTTSTQLGTLPVMLGLETLKEDALTSLEGIVEQGPHGHPIGLRNGYLREAEGISTVYAGCRYGSFPQTDYEVHGEQKAYFFEIVCIIDYFSAK